MENTTDSGIGARAKRWIAPAIIGVVLVLVYDIMVLAGAIGLISTASLIQIYALLEIVNASGHVLLALGFHALYLVYNRVHCRIAFFGFILAPVLLVMRILPMFLAYFVWIYVAANLVIPLLGAMAFFSLRREGTALFMLSSAIVILGVLIDLLSFMLSAGFFFVIGAELAAAIRSAGRIFIWVFVGVVFAWTYRNSPSV